jgi:hypothetical protein
MPTDVQTLAFSRPLAGHFTHRSVSITVPDRQSPQLWFVVLVIISADRSDVWCPWGNGSALLAREISRLSDVFNRGFTRNCVPAASPARKGPRTPDSGLILQRQFVTARSVTVDVMRPPPDDPKVCGQQKIVRWPLASA